MFKKYEILEKFDHSSYETVPSARHLARVSPCDGKVIQTGNWTKWPNGNAPIDDICCIAHQAVTEKAKRRGDFGRLGPFFCGAEARKWLTKADESIKSFADANKRRIILRASHLKRQSFTSHAGQLRCNESSATKEKLANTCKENGITHDDFVAWVWAMQFNGGMRHIPSYLAILDQIKSALA